MCEFSLQFLHENVHLSCSFKWTVLIGATTLILHSSLPKNYSQKNFRKFNV